MKSARLRSRLIRMLPWLLGTAGASGAFLLAASLLLTRDPHPDLEKSLPAGCGAQGPGFEVRCPEGVPYLAVRGLPYPTGYDSTDHPLQSLDGTWMMRRDPSERGLDSFWSLGDWEDTVAVPIAVPSTYNLPSGRLSGHQGVVWFSRRFDARRFGALLPDVAKPGSGWVRLGFQGVLLRCKVWLNGVYLGEHEGGYTPFYFDVTAHLKAGEPNILVVRADNRLTYSSLPPRVRPKHNPVWGVYGGIYREVALEALPARSLFKATVRAYRDTSGQGFDINALLHARQGGAVCSLSLTLTDPEGKVVGSAFRIAPAETAVTVHSFRLPLERVEAWAPRKPALYGLRVRVGGPSGSETVWIKAGHRILAVDGEALRLDGRKLFLKGISKMEDDPLLGQTQTKESVERDLRLARELGANYIRLAHYPHHPAEVAAARDMGIMLAEEIPFFHVGAGWSQWLVDFQGLDGFPYSSYGLKQLHRRDLLLHAQQSLIELIERDGNNPAVILWSLGNESYSLNDRAGRVYGWLRDVARAFDPTRPSSMAEMTYYVPLLDDRRRASHHLDLASLNAYYGWYFGEAEGIAAHMDRFHERNPGQGMLLSEFGAEAALGRKEEDGIRLGDRVFFPRTYSEAYQASLLEKHVRLAWKRS